MPHTYSPKDVPHLTEGHRVWLQRRLSEQPMVAVEHAPPTEPVAQSSQTTMNLHNSSSSDRMELLFARNYAGSVVSSSSNGSHGSTSSSSTGSATSSAILRLKQTGDNLESQCNETGYKIDVLGQVFDFCKTEGHMESINESHESSDDDEHVVPQHRFR